MFFSSQHNLDIGNHPCACLLKEPFHGIYPGRTAKRGSKTEEKLTFTSVFKDDLNDILVRLDGGLKPSAISMKGRDVMCTGIFSHFYTIEIECKGALASGAYAYLFVRW